jgi:hypothetical protein
VVLVAPGAPHRDAAQDEHADEGDDLEAVGAAVPVDSEVGDREQSCPVEDDPRPDRPARDLLAPLPPHDVDEERNREEEGDARDDQQREQRRLQLQRDDDRDDGEDDQEPARRRVHVAEEGSHVPVM